MKSKLAVVFVMLACSISAQDIIPLYDGKPMGSEDWTWDEQIYHHDESGQTMVYNVTQPTLTAYLPPYYLATGTAVIIAPGGAFHLLSMESEGIEVAKWLNSIGVAAFVLKYRLARSYTKDPVSEVRNKLTNFEELDAENRRIVPLAMADGLAAVRYVRDHAKELEVDPDKIGFMGFSAGGTLAMSVVYTGTNRDRPSFVPPIYPYEKAIIGSEVPEEQTPIFLTVAADDQLGMTMHSINIYRKWHGAKQPAELHIYQQGGHGFGMRSQGLPTDTWYERFGEWLQLQGYLKRLHPSKYEKLYGEEAVARGEIEHVAQMMRDFGNLARYREENRLVPSPNADEKRVVFLGNSITEGWVRTDSAFFANNHFIGRGISGQTSTQLLLRFRQDVVALEPKVVVIHIGTNDIAENTGPYNPEFTLGNIKSMVELAKVHAIEVILASVLPSTKFEWRRSLGDRSNLIVDLNAKIKSYAEQNQLPFIDYHSAMKNTANGMDADLAEDGVHPTLKGYKIMESLVLPEVEKIRKKL